jgi:hypothetical protein
MAAALASADFWAILLGNAYFHPHWDPAAADTTTQVPLAQCAACGTVSPPDVIQSLGGQCPQCHTVGAFRPATNPDGTPATQSVSAGGGRTLVASPLELLLPLYAQSFDAVDRLVYLTWLPRHQVEELCPDASRRISWTRSPQQRSLQLYRSLSMMSDLPQAPQVWQTSATQQEVDGCTVQYLWIRPCARYPRGVYLPFLGEGSAAVPARELIEQQAANGEGGGTTPEIPYTTAQGDPVWPWVHYPYKPIGGRLYAQSAVDSILQKQDQVNQIDSMTQLTANRMGNPIWLEPKGAEVERFTGEPGLVVRWQPLGANGAKPERIPGENPPQSFFALRQQYLADIEDLAGTYDVVKGAKPSGVEAFSALQLLVERSQSRFTPVFKARGEAYRQWFEVAIELERTYGPDQRVRSVLGPNNAWTFQSFQKANIQGAITIHIEDGSNAPKTALGRRAAMEHANQLGLLAPRANPDQQYAMLQELGAGHLMPSLDADVESALQEQHAFEEWVGKGMAGGPTASPLIRLPWHNDAVHLQENRKWMNGDRVRDLLAAAPAQLRPILVQVLGAHLEQHQSMLMMAQAQAAGGAVPGAPPPGPGAPPPPPGTPPQPPGSPAGRDGGGIGAGRAAHDSNAHAAHPAAAPPGLPPA